jgi:hypothetical protein
MVWVVLSFGCSVTKRCYEWRKILVAAELIDGAVLHKFGVGSSYVMVCAVSGAA